jgi:hypothetical protein
MYNDLSSVSSHSTHPSSTLNERNTQLPVNNKKRTSVVWEYFFEEKNSHEEVVAIICNLCKQSWRPGNTTGTLATHLNNKHKNNIILKQQTLTTFTDTPYTRKEECARTRLNNNTFVDI